MSKKKRKPVDLGKIVSRIVCVFMLVAGLYLNGWGAELPVRIGLTTPACSLRVLAGTGVPPVYSDTGAWYTNVQAIETTVTYTPGEFVQRLIEFKYGCTDSMIPWEMNPFNSAAAATLDSQVVYGAVAQVAMDSSALYQGTMGSGPYSVSIVALNAADSTVINGVSFMIRTVDQSSPIASPPPTQLGVTSWNATADSFLYISLASGFSGPTYDTAVITGVQTDTVFLTAFNPGAPADTFLCRVYGYLRDLRSDPTYSLFLGVRKKGVCFQPTALVTNTCNDTRPLSGPYCTKTNDSGYFFIDLVRSSCLPKGTDSVKYYLAIDGKDTEILITVPDTSEYRITF